MDNKSLHELKNDSYIYFTKLKYISRGERFQNW